MKVVPVQNILERTAQYLSETLGARVTPVPWRDERLPHFLKESYKFSEIELLGAKCLLMLDVSLNEQAPAVLRKHIRLVRAR